jgi:RNA polymerase sigma factor (sigma-70 family)
VGDRAEHLPGGDSRALDELARLGYAALVARLVRALGPQHLELCEDVVQEAFVRALRAWGPGTTPREPERWLVRVAKHLAVDTLRRRAHGAHIYAELQTWTQEAGAGGAAPSRLEDTLDDGYAADDTLRMMFLCAHPALAPEARTALVLKTVCGLGNAAIAAALLAKEATIAQRLTRAKAKLVEAEVQFELPEMAALPARLESVLEVLYLLFNEGYRAHGGTDLVRVDVVHEAVRLVQLLVAHPATCGPSVHALAALFFLQGARLPARLDAEGELLTLAEQDRSRWDPRWIAAGMAHFRASIGGSELGVYHIEAAIASLHACAPSYAATNWSRVLEEYDRLLSLRDDAVVRLNRAVAVAKVHGIASALHELDALDEGGDLVAYGLRLATRGQLLWADGRPAMAAAAFAGALELPCTAPERRLLEGRLAACRGGVAAPPW